MAVRIARTVGIDFILNTVQDRSGVFFSAVAGELEAAHEKGIELGRPYWELVLPRRYDVVIITPGGYSRDIDLHQAQKSVSTAEMVIAPGGIIVLVAECRCPGPVTAPGGQLYTPDRKIGAEHESHRKAGRLCSRKPP